VNDRAQLEHAIQNEIRNALTDECFLFRANVGRGWQGVGKPERVPHPCTVHMRPGDVLLRQARPFDTGLPPGFADLFGWREVTITPDMIGQKVAVFVAAEVKTQTGAVRDAQIAFVNAVKNAGGRAGFARSVEDARAIVRGEHARITLRAGNAEDRAPVKRRTVPRVGRTAAPGASNGVGDDHRE